MAIDLLAIIQLFKKTYAEVPMENALVFFPPFVNHPHVTFSVPLRLVFEAETSIKSH